MGVSFKVSKKGTRFRPKPAQLGILAGDVGEPPKEGDDPYFPEKRLKSEVTTPFVVDFRFAFLRFAGWVASVVWRISSSVDLLARP